MVVKVLAQYPAISKGWSGPLSSIAQIVITMRLKRGVTPLPVTGRGQGFGSGSVTDILCGAEQDSPPL